MLMGETEVEAMIEDRCYSGLLSQREGFLIFMSRGIDCWEEMWVSESLSMSGQLSSVIILSFGPLSFSGLLFARLTGSGTGSMSTNSKAFKKEGSTDFWAITEFWELLSSPRALRFLHTVTLGLMSKVSFGFATCSSNEAMYAFKVFVSLLSFSNSFCSRSSQVLLN